MDSFNPLSTGLAIIGVARLRRVFFPKRVTRTLITYYVIDMPGEYVKANAIGRSTSRGIICSNQSLLSRGRNIYGV